MDFHNLVLTFLYGMECPLCGTCAGWNQGLERPCANNLDVVGMGVTKYSQQMLTNLLSLPAPGLFLLQAHKELRVRRSADMCGSPKEKAQPQSCGKRDLTLKTKKQKRKWEVRNNMGIH